jgi:IS30 family transposase
MNTCADRARQILRHIADVLRRNWDPLRVADHPETSDEYDSYVGGVYRLLETNASAKQIAEHLVRLETEMLGYEDTRASTLMPVAKKLLKIKDRFRLGEGAASQAAAADGRRSHGRGLR